MPRQQPNLQSRPLFSCRTHRRPLSVGRLHGLGRLQRRRSSLITSTRSSSTCTLMSSVPVSSGSRISRADDRCAAPTEVEEKEAEQEKQLFGGGGRLLRAGFLRLLLRRRFVRPSVQPEHHLSSSTCTDSSPPQSPPRTSAPMPC